MINFYTFHEFFRTLWHRIYPAIDRWLYFWKTANVNFPPLAFIMSFWFSPFKLASCMARNQEDCFLFISNVSLFPYISTGNKIACIYHWIKWLLLRKLFLNVNFYLTSIFYSKDYLWSKKNKKCPPKRVSQTVYSSNLSTFRILSQIYQSRWFTDIIMWISVIYGIFV